MSHSQHPLRSPGKVVPHLITLLGISALLIAGLVAVTHTDNGDSTPGPPAGPRTVPLELGVTVFTLWRDWEMHDELMDRVRDSGSRWLRVDMGWCSLQEAGPRAISTWYQDRLDATVAGAVQRGLRLLVTIGCAPGWAGGTSYSSFPTDLAAFQRVAHYLAYRYKGKVAAWEIWNEPDCVGGCARGSPEEFVKTLRAGYQGFKSGDPAATVVSGGTSGNNASWIRQMYAAGARGWFDALAVHPYQHPPSAPPDAPPQGNIYRLTSLPAVREQMVRNGDAGKPVWLTEFGWSTALTGARIGVSEAVQARYLAQAVSQIRTMYPYVTEAFWYCMRDRDDSTPYENDFGLLQVDGSAKPAFPALQRANADLEAMR